MTIASRRIKNKKEPGKRKITMQILELMKFAHIYLGRLQHSQRKLFDFLRWYRKHYQVVFPSLDTIAKGIGFSKSTVQRGLKVLAECGFLMWMRRPLQSNVYMVRDDLVDVDFREMARETRWDGESGGGGAEVEKAVVPRAVNTRCNVDDHVLEELNIIHISTEGCAVRSHGEKGKKAGSVRDEEAVVEAKDADVHIPEFLNIRCLDRKQRVTLVKNFSESNLVNALDDIKWYARQAGKKIHDHYRMLFKMALRWKNGTRKYTHKERV